MKTKETTISKTDTVSEKNNRKWSAVVLTVLLCAAILLCVLVMGQILSKGYVSLGGYSLFRVITGSMEPEIPVGSVLVARQTAMEQIRPNDIVTFRSREPGMFKVIITHRVLAVCQGSGGKLYLETKGDANPYADAQYVDSDYLIGKVVFYTGQNNVFARILRFLTSQVGFLACIVLPCILIGLFVMRDSIRSMRKELDAINRELEEANQETAPQTEQMDAQEYEDLCNRLREELQKELNQGAEPETTEQEPGALQS